MRETGGKNNNGAWVVGRVFSRGFRGLVAWFCRVGASAHRCTVRVKNRWPRKVVARRTGRRAVEPVMRGLKVVWVVWLSSVGVYLVRKGTSGGGYWVGGLLSRDTKRPLVG